MLLILFRLCLKIPVLWKYCYIYNNINTVKNKLEKEWRFGFYLDRIKYLLIGSFTNVSVTSKSQHMIQNSGSVCHESHLFRKRQQNRNRCCSVWMQISWLFVCKQKIINTSCKNYARARGIKYNNDRHFICIPKAENVSLNTVYYWLQKLKTH